MLQQSSRQRLTADNQFLKIQNRSLSRDRIASETDSIIQQRVDNTARLRGLRIAKEEQDRALALASPPAPKKRQKSPK